MTFPEQLDILNRACSKISLVQLRSAVQLALNDVFDEFDIKFDVLAYIKYVFKYLYKSAGGAIGSLTCYDGPSKLETHHWLHDSIILLINP